MNPYCLRELINKLKEAILDERRTAVLYACLSDMSESFQGVDAFAEARRDELDHAATLTRIVEKLTGRTPREATQPVEVEPIRDYCSGVRAAICGERDVIREYTELIELSRSRKLDRILEGIRADEEVHYAKFRKLYDTECVKPCVPCPSQDPWMSYASHIPYDGYS